MFENDFYIEDGNFYVEDNFDIEDYSYEPDSDLWDDWEELANTTKN